MLESAQGFGQPPSSFLGGAGGWTDRDRLIIYAWTLYRAGLCPECGRPRQVCETGAWEVETRVCGPTAAAERWRKDNTKPEPGTRITTVQVTDDRVAESLLSAPRWWVEQHRPDLLDEWDAAHN